VTDDEIKAAVRRMRARDRATGRPVTVTNPEILAELVRIIEDSARRRLGRR
jgi:hypothetical protein